MMNNPSENSLLEDLVALGRFEDFSRASKYAANLARNFKSPTGVKRDEYGWAVYAAPFVQVVRQQYGLTKHAMPLCYGQSTSDIEDPEIEVQKEILAEIEEDRDSWEQSRESGWFYNETDKN